MANEILLKRSSVANKVPDAANVAVGEPVVNLNDKILYTKNATGTVIVIGAGTTSNITEGVNLYYSNARVYANVNSIGYATNSNVALKANVADLTTANVAEVTNQYFTNARVNTALQVQTLGNATFAGSVRMTNNLTMTGDVYIANGSGAGGGSEGGQLNLATAPSNSTLSGPIAIDIYENKLRMFETAGTNRGVYVDLSTAGAGVSTNLIGGGTGTITAVAGITSGAVTNAQLAAATVYSQTLTNATFSANVTADRFISNNNGNGENLKVGDDVWIGDTNLTNTLRVKGQQDATQAYIIFGNNDGITLGRSGSGALTYGGEFTATGNVSTGNVSGTAATFTLSRLGTVQSGTWNGSSISTTYTDAKVTAVNGRTGAVTGLAETANSLSQFASTTSAQLATVISDETGSGNLVFATSPTLTTPNIGAATGTSLVLSANVIARDAILSGNLIVSGTLTTVNTEEINLADNQIVLNSNHTGAPTQDGGLIINRGSSANVSIFWDETNDRWSVNNSSATYIIHNTGRDVVLGTETSGVYVANLVQGTGITLTNLAGEGATPTVALATSGVTAATYGSSSSVPSLVVDTYGRVTSAANITLTTANVTELTNLYFTNARAVSAVTAAGITSLDNNGYTFALASDGKISITGNVFNTGTNPATLWSTDSVTNYWRSPTGGGPGLPLNSLVKVNGSGATIQLDTGILGLSSSLSWVFDHTGNITFPDSTVQTTAFNNTAARAAFIAGTGITIEANGRISASATGSGNVSNSTTATDNQIVRFDGATGAVIQNSAATIDDTGNINTTGKVTASSGYYDGNSNRLVIKDQSGTIIWG